MSSSSEYGKKQQRKRDCGVEEMDERIRGECGRKGSSVPVRRKTKVEYIEPKARRSVRFCKRRNGIMKKAYELSVMTGAEILLVVASESGYVYTFTTEKLKGFLYTQERNIHRWLSDEYPREMQPSRDYLGGDHFYGEFAVPGPFGNDPGHGGGM